MVELYGSCVSENVAVRNASVLHQKRKCPALDTEVPDVGDAAGDVLIADSVL